MRSIIYSHGEYVHTPFRAIKLIVKITNLHWSNAYIKKKKKKNRDICIREYSVTLLEINI